jgi:hypothetical protein
LSCPNLTQPKGTLHRHASYRIQVLLMRILTEKGRDRYYRRHGSLPLAHKATPSQKLQLLRCKNGYTSTPQKTKSFALNEAVHLSTPIRAESSHLVPSYELCHHIPNHKCVSHTAHLWTDVATNTNSIGTYSKRARQLRDFQKKATG